MNEIIFKHNELLVGRSDLCVVNYWGKKKKGHSRRGDPKQLVRSFSQCVSSELCGARRYRHSGLVF